MANWIDIEAFLAAVLPWPGPNDPGRCGLISSFPGKGWTLGQKLSVGRAKPFASAADMVVQVHQQLNNTQWNRDMWFCTSQQGQLITDAKHNKTYLKRDTATTVSSKSIFVDLDVDPNDPNKYATPQDGIKAIFQFAKDEGIPSPSAIVGSGGGAHVYWISDKALTPDEWRPFATGLKNRLIARGIKFDVSCTADIVRILRMPGTLNYKTNPPRPTTLGALPLKLYDFEAQLGVLKQYTDSATPARATAAPKTLFADGVDPSLFRAGPAAEFDSLKGLKETLADGLQIGGHLVDPRPIFRDQTKGGCKLYRDTLASGGAGQSQPMWNALIAGTTFMEGGNEIAHQISDKHADYTPDDAQAFFDRKMDERRNSKFGYPKCATFNSLGSPVCTSCPLFKDGKSPLNIRPKIAATVMPTGQTLIPLPFPFEYDEKNRIVRVTTKEGKKEGDAPTIKKIIIFDAVLSNFSLQKNPGEQIVFNVTLDKGFADDVSLDMGDIGSLNLSSILLRKRVLIAPGCPPMFVKDFFLSVIGKLRELASAQQSVPFGWFFEDGDRRGFAFGGTLFKDDGTEQRSSVPDITIKKMYGATGKPEPWWIACKTVTDRKRQELNCILLMAFASPLISVNGKNTAVLAAHGTDSGAGKTTTSSVGAAVWGHPKNTKIGQRGTENSIGSRLKTTRHLPAYWDEQKGEKTLQKFNTMMQEIDSGTEKSRMLDGQRMQESGEYQLMMMYTANRSLVEFLRDEDENTVAMVMRVLEYGDLKTLTDGVGNIFNADAEARVNKLSNNYGHMGLVYAKHLAMNHKRIEQQLLDKSNELETFLCGGPGKGQTERYWLATIATLTIAAQEAKTLGVDVDPVDIERFLIGVYHDNKAKRDAYAKGGSVDNSEDALTRWLKEMQAGGHGLWTNYMNYTKGRPAKPVLVRHGIDGQRNTQGGFEFRFAEDNNALIIAEQSFKKFLKAHKLNSTAVMKKIDDMYHIQTRMIKIGSGTIVDSGRENCHVLTIGYDTPLWEMMLAFTPLPDRERLTAAAMAGRPTEQLPEDMGFEEELKNAA